MIRDKEMASSRIAEWAPKPPPYPKGSPILIQIELSLEPLFQHWSDDGSGWGREFRQSATIGTSHRSRENIVLSVFGRVLQSVRAVPRAVLPMLLAADELRDKLASRRRARGSIDFDLPEPVILLDDRGEMTGITARLTSSTPGVTIAQPTGQYPDLAAEFKRRMAGSPTVCRKKFQPT